MSAVLTMVTVIVCMVIISIVVNLLHYTGCHHLIILLIISLTSIICYQLITHPIYFQLLTITCTYQYKIAHLYHYTLLLLLSTNLISTYHIVNANNIMNKYSNNAHYLFSLLIITMVMYHN